MLKIVDKLSGLDIAQLKQVYSQSIINGSEAYRRLAENLRILEAEQDFYESLRQFYSQKGSFYALWAPGATYVSALRIEPYCDGLILTGLETAPESRGCGFATSLIKETQKYLKGYGYRRIYSHVSKDNAVSIAVHRNCGFSVISDFAVYLDGTKDTNAVTMLYEC